MKRIVSAALVASLMAGSALAQPPERGGRGEGGEQRAQRQEQRQERQQQRQQRQEQRQERQQAQPQQQRPERQERPQQQQQQQRPQRQAQPQQQAPELRGGPPQPGRGSYLRSPDDRRQEWRGGVDPRQVQPQSRPDDRQIDRNRTDPRDSRYQQQWRGDNRGQQWSQPRQFRDRDRGRPQFDQRRYRPSYRAPQRYRITPYRAPPGFYVRSWGFGDRLPYGWYGQSYYLSWGAYGLPLPPIGAEWVRVGNDALLVDVWTGEVLSVYYDLFW